MFKSSTPIPFICVNIAELDRYRIYMHQLKSIFLIFITLCGTWNCSREDIIAADGSLIVNFEIKPGLSPLETHYFIVENIPSIYAQSLTQKGLTKENIKQVNATSGLLASRLGGGNLSFISNVSVRIFQKSDSKNRLEVLYNEQIPVTSNSSIQLIPALSDIRSIVENELVDIEIRLQFRAFPPTNMAMTVNFDYLAISK